MAMNCKATVSLDVAVRELHTCTNVPEEPAASIFSTQH
jgi:hypothetical protein